MAWIRATIWTLTALGAATAQEPVREWTLGAITNGLGAARFAERDEATKALIAADPQVLGLVAAAACDSDPEVRARAFEVIRGQGRVQDPARIRASTAALRHVAEHGPVEVRRTATKELADGRSWALGRLTRLGAKISRSKTSTVYIRDGWTGGPETQPRSTASPTSPRSTSTTPASTTRWCPGCATCANSSRSTSRAPP